MELCVARPFATYTTYSCVSGHNQRHRKESRVCSLWYSLRAEAEQSDAHIVCHWLTLQLDGHAPAREGHDSVQPKGH